MRSKLAIGAAIAGMLGFLGLILKHQKPWEEYPIQVIESERAILDAHKEMAADPQNLRLYVTEPTGSMRPQIESGDIVISKAVPFKELKKGQIVNYRPKWNNGKLTLHRLVENDKDGWIASGDNNSRSENWERVTEANYDSVLVRIYRNKKKK